MIIERKMFSFRERFQNLKNNSLIETNCPDSIAKDMHVSGPILNLKIDIL